MILLSFILNTLLFFLLVNSSYLKKKRSNPDYPDKPFSKLILFPLTLGIVFTLIIDVFRGIIMYQLLLFAIIALMLYWFFYVFNKNE